MEQITYLLFLRRLDDLHTLARALLEYETLSGDEIIAVLKGVAPNRDDSDSKRSMGPAVSVPLSPRGPVSSAPEASLLGLTV